MNNKIKKERSYRRQKTALEIIIEKQDKLRKQMMTRNNKKSI